MEKRRGRSSRKDERASRFFKIHGRALQFREGSRDERLEILIPRTFGIQGSGCRDLFHGRTQLRWRDLESLRSVAGRVYSTDEKGRSFWLCKGVERMRCFIVGRANVRRGCLLPCFPTWSSPLLFSFT